MFRQRLIEGGLVLFLLTFFPGCHVLVRLSEPAGQEPAPVIDADERREGVSPLNSRPETPRPPLPRLSPEPARQQNDSTAKTETAKRIARYRRLQSNTGINTNTAIKPGAGQYVYRTQLRFKESHSSPGAADVDVSILVNPHLLAYGVNEKLTVIGVVPLVLREGTKRPPAGGFSGLDEQGVADLRFFGVYRFYTEDRPGETTRWSALAGLEIPTYDKLFSSDSWDPFIGTVWTYQSLEWGLDLDLVWQFNTGEGFDRHDTMSYNGAYTYVLLTGQNLVNEQVWALNSIFEINALYNSEGSHLVFASPGFQLALENMIVEASLQLPVIRDLKSGLEPDFLFAVGTRITW